MATINSGLYDKQVGTDAAKASIGDIGGRVRSVYFSVTGVAVIAIDDKLKLFKLPAGARVIDWQISIPSTGTTGIFKLGNAVSADAVEAADDDAFGSGYDAGGQAVSAKPGALGSEGGLNKKYASEVDVELVATEATDVGAVVIKGHFTYVIE